MTPWISSSLREPTLASRTSRTGALQILPEGHGGRKSFGFWYQLSNSELRTTPDPQQRVLREGLSRSG